MDRDLADAYLKVLHTRENSWNEATRDYDLDWWQAAEKARIPAKHKETVISLLVAGFCEPGEAAMRSASPLMRTREHVRCSALNRKYSGRG